ADGSLARTRVARARDWTFDSATRTLLYVAPGGDLSRTDGVNSSVVVGPRVVGNPRGLSIDVLGHDMMALVSMRRVVVLDGHGRLFASSSIPRTESGAPEQLSSFSVVQSQNGQAVAYSVADRREGSASVGPESILLLRRGDRSPTVLATKTVSFAGCERGVDLTWHGSWILYHSTEGDIVAIDSTRRHGA